MLKLLLIVACLFIQGCVTPNSPDSIIVTGVGRTINDAKEDAFRHAVEQQIGVLIHSGRETKNDVLEKNDILAYSAGYVDDFNIISTIIQNNTAYVQMEVWVSSSRIENKILSSGISNKDVLGKRLQVQYNTFLTERVTGDKLLLKLLNQYPYMAYEIETGPIQFQYDVNRDSVLIVPYKMYWNKDYIQSLNESLGVLSDRSESGKMAARTITIKGKKNSDFLIGYTTTHQFNDTIRFDYVRKTIDNSNLRIRVTIKKDNLMLHTMCWIPGTQLYGLGQYDMTIEGNQVDRDYLKIDIPRQSHLHRVMNQMNNIQLSIDEVSRCHDKR